MITKNWWVLGAFLLPFNVAVADIDDDLKGIDTMAPAGVTKAATTAAKNAIADGMPPAKVYEQLKVRGVPPEVAGQAVTQNLPADRDDPANQEALSRFESALSEDGLVVNMATLEVTSKQRTFDVSRPIDATYGQVQGTGSGAGGGGGGVSEPSASLGAPPASPF